MWSSEVMAELAGRGHSIGPEAAGQHLTLSGVDWLRLRPGTRLLAGTAHLELAYPVIPRQQGRWFSDRNIGRLSHDEHPECAGWHAWVRRPGLIRPCDVAVISPSQLI